MRLGALERDRGGVASALDPPPLFPVPGPKTCVLENGRGGGVSPPLPIRLLETGGEEGLRFRRGALSRNILHGATRGRRGSCGVVGATASGQRATAIADHGPLTDAAGGS